MKPRQLAYEITPIHSWYGYKAPSIHVNATKYEEALREAKSRCTLVNRFPDKWILV